MDIDRTLSNGIKYLYMDMPYLYGARHLKIAFCGDKKVSLIKKIGHAVIGSLLLVPVLGLIIAIAENFFSTCCTKKQQPPLVVNSGSGKTNPLNIQKLTSSSEQPQGNSTLNSALATSVVVVKNPPMPPANDNAGIQLQPPQNLEPLGSKNLVQTKPPSTEAPKSSTIEPIQTQQPIQVAPNISQITKVERPSVHQNPNKNPTAKNVEQPALVQPNPIKIQNTEQPPLVQTNPIKIQNAEQPPLVQTNPIKIQNAQQPPLVQTNPIKIQNAQQPPLVQPNQNNNPPAQPNPPNPNNVAPQPAAAQLPAKSDEELLYLKIERAVIDNNLEEVNTLLSDNRVKGQFLNKLYGDRTLLHKAVKNFTTKKNNDQKTAKEIIKALLKKGADPNILGKGNDPNTYGMTPFYLACRKGVPNWESVAYRMLAYGANPCIPHFHLNPTSQENAYFIFEKPHFRHLASTHEVRVLLDKKWQHQIHDIQYTKNLCTLWGRTTKLVCNDKIIQLIGGNESENVNALLVRSFAKFAQEPKGVIELPAMEGVVDYSREEFIQVMQNLLSMLQVSQYTLDDHLPDLVKTIKNSKIPVIIPSGWYEHATAIVIFGDRIIRCNLNEADRAGLVIDKFNPDKLTPEILKKICVSPLRKTENTRNYFYRDLERDLEMDLNHNKLLKLNAQKYANCSWSSSALLGVIGALYLTYIKSEDLDRVDDDYLGLEQVIFNAILEYALRFEHFTQFFTMEEYLENITQAKNNNVEIPLNWQLITGIIAKCKNPSHSEGNEYSGKTSELFKNFLIPVKK